jgi:hypothetical protein
MAKIFEFKPQLPNKSDSDPEDLEKIRKEALENLIKLGVSANRILESSIPYNELNIILSNKAHIYSLMGGYSKNAYNEYIKLLSESTLNELVQIAAKELSIDYLLKHISYAHALFDLIDQKDLAEIKNRSRV